MTVAVICGTSFIPMRGKALQKIGSLSSRSVKHAAADPSALGGKAQCPAGKGAMAMTCPMTMMVVMTEKEEEEEEEPLQAVMLGVHLVMAVLRGVSGV